jgi:hypothetical protein
MDTGEHFTRERVLISNPQGEWCEVVEAYN